MPKTNWTCSKNEPKKQKRTRGNCIVASPASLTWPAQPGQLITYKSLPERSRHFFFQMYSFRFSCLNEFGQLVDIEKSAFVTCGASTHLLWTMFRKSFFVRPYRTNWMRKRILNKLSWNASLCSVIDAFVPSFTHDHSHDPFVRSSLISKWSLSWCIHRERSWSIMSLHDAPWALTMHRQYSWFVLGHP